MLAMIWAQAHGRAIGKDGTLPWHVPEDMAMFKRVTMGHPVIMGRKTWESFDPRWRPLPGRTNIVVTRDPSYEALGASVATSVEDAYAIAQEYLTKETASGTDLVWLIGGAQLYSYAIEHDLAEAVLMTELDIDVLGASAFAPSIPDHWEQIQSGLTLVQSDPAFGWRTSEKSDVRYRSTLYRKPESDFWLDTENL